MSVRLGAPGRMEGRVVVVTGASSGIGRAAARELALLGAEVAVVGRNRERTHAVAAETGGRAFLADFDRLASVRELGAALLDAYPRIHVLANNAGGMAPRGTTGDGFGITFQRNHLAGFLLTDLLRDRLLATAAEEPGTVRVIQTSSAANTSGKVRLDDLDELRGPWLGGWRAYGTAKLENVLFTRELARRTVETGIGTWSFHPGFVATGFGGSNPLIGLAKRAALSPEQGAQPLVRLAASPAVPAPSGNHFSRLAAPGSVARQADDAGLARALWEASAARVGG
ncbi:SDR family NAD(P)-dependent oxidoreductase [Amnibacterium kyonggiense]|uniref:NAD(P)-dependent dehydrogenase (Short-subunit alcohol dehydrogenase family) n=1 Tax=Amnibacterium kyonggiense TaxID=595671 RepID=A0A4R7FET6_9MICO|nr:NAD(P)-dependent dehydrogenase (short-subunit alcohol dehydrogenase family) [Amnibacterium kyonggiense]